MGDTHRQTNGGSRSSRTNARAATVGEPADIMVTAGLRKGYSKTLRESWVAKAPRLEPLREREDWTAMVADPSGWLAAASAKE